MHPNMLRGKIMIIFAIGCIIHCGYSAGNGYQAPPPLVNSLGSDEIDGSDGSAEVFDGSESTKVPDFVDLEMKPELGDSEKIPFFLSEDFDENIDKRCIRHTIEEAAKLMKKQTGKTIDFSTSDFPIPKMEEFLNFVSGFAKQYKNKGEQRLGFENFKVNKLMQLAFQQGSSGSANFGDTTFSDMSDSVFSNGFLKGTNPIPACFEPEPEELADNIDVPAEGVNWVERGKVTPVKYQGTCGSCYVFAAAAVIESNYAIAKDVDVKNVSAQQLLDCDHSSSGCNGGWPSQTFDVIKDLGWRLDILEDNPYIGTQKDCTRESALPEPFINRTVILKNDEDSMARWVAKHGPIAVILNGYTGFRYYTGGIMRPSDPTYCDPDWEGKGLAHAVTIVGFGMEQVEGEDLPYWLIKNSWGRNWGEEGYARLYRGENTCGIVTRNPMTVIIE